MTLVEDRDRWSALVVAARDGDVDAWSALIDRFEDLAVATAVGLCGDLDEAWDIAQDAFVLAWRHLNGLQDATAFPAWLLRLLRTATSRRTRRPQVPTTPLERLLADEGPAAVPDPRTGPEEVVVAATESSRVRAAVERLPEGERCVVALHHLAGLPYAEVAAFLGISVPAAKKRAWSARARLKELLPIVTDAFTAARPSRTEAFRDTILLFQAIRTGDTHALARLLAGPGRNAAALGQSEPGADPGQTPITPRRTRHRRRATRRSTGAPYRSTNDRLEHAPDPGERDRRSRIATLRLSPSLADESEESLRRGLPH